MSHRIKLFVPVFVFLVLVGAPAPFFLPPNLGERAVIDAAMPLRTRRMLARRLVTLGHQLNLLASRYREQRARERLEERLGHPIRSEGTLLTCPVAGVTAFTDDFGAPRPGGRTHEGVDLNGPAGRALVAVQAGTVTRSASVLGGLGIHLWARNGDEFYYAHLSAYEASGHVRAGTIIGRVGSTGDATGPHLHFEYHPGGGSAVDPYRFLRQVC
jgi:murein DD-endopeptidase MepM/ murein hydrolase activator NlpD